MISASDRGVGQRGGGSFLQWIGHWAVAGLLLPAGSSGQAASAWEIYTKEGVEYRAPLQPTTIEVGWPEEVEVPSAVTGTGQGKRLTDVEVVVSEGVGGRPAKGVVDEGVYSLAEDQGGNIWVATQEGLSRFDGKNWTTFTEEDGLAENWILDVDMDSQGHLWFIGVGGVTRFDGKRWISYKVVPSGSDLAIAPNGDVWVPGNPYYDSVRKAIVGTLLRFDGQNWWEYGPEDGIPFPGSIDRVEVDPTGKIWVNITGSTGF